MLRRDRERDRAAAGADVEDARCVRSFDQGERPLDDDLRLRTRHQRARVGLQRQSPEAPLAEDVGERLALPPALEKWFEPRRQLPVAQRVDLSARDAEHIRDEELRVDARRVHSRFRELLLREAQRLRDGHSPSARRRSSAVSASVNSSSSPCRMRSS